MRYAGLRFFKGIDSEIALKYDSVNDLFEGSVNLDEVSTGLYETATIFVLEEVVSQYGAPLLITPIGSNVGSQFNFKFVDTEYTSKDINLMTASITDGDVAVKLESSINLDPQNNSVAVSTTDGIHTIGSTYTTEALQITAALNSNIEGPHFRYLQVTDNIDDKVIAIIEIYGETVAEDERLAVLLSNLGANITVSDQFLFKDHDINEVGTDWMLINRKRKEMLLELSNIKPFVGTYKALINAIKFFGYNNLTLKEYWLVIDDRSPMFGKLKAFEVPGSTKGSFVSNKIRGVQLPSSTYKKTSRFGLFYKLNTPNGNFDKWDIAEVDEVFDFTPDEVLIKLYGLKGKLQRDYLPLNAKIIDIIGEGDFFTNYNTNIWNNQNPITSVTGGVEPKIEIHNTDPYIEDLSLVSNLYEGKTQDFADLSVIDMATLYSDTETFYNDYYNLTRTTYADITEELPIGAPVMLECTSFDDTWDAALFTWEDAETYITWDNWWKRNVYELKWTITGPNNWNQVIVGSIDDVLKVAVALPFKGTYSLTFEQTDLFNHTTILRYPNSIEVKMKQLEVYGVYRWMDRERYDWFSSNFKWGNAGGSWGFPQQNDDTVDQEIGTLYLTLDRSNYLHDESHGINFSMVRRLSDGSETTGPYFWRNLKNQAWNDGKHTWWDATVVGADVAASFTITQMDINSIMTIKHYDYNTNSVITGSHTFVNDLNDPLNLTEWINAAADLNASTDPVISKFIYNPILLDNLAPFGPGDEDECVGILATAKQYSSTYDYLPISEAGIVITFGAGTIEDEVHYMAYNPTFNDVQIAEAHAEIELLTHMTFSADKSRMPGKLKYDWKLHNSSKDVDDIYYNSKWLTYLFEHKGDYNLELEVTDVNGNTNKLVKNALTIK